MLRSQHELLFLRWVSGGTMLHFLAGEKQGPHDSLMTELQTHLGKADSS